MGAAAQCRAPVVLGVLVALGLSLSLSLGGCGGDSGDAAGWDLGSGEDAHDATPDGSGADAGEGDADANLVPDAGEDCAVAVATATVEGGGEDEPATRLSAPLFSTIQLDATWSFAPRGGVARYEWTILSAPSDSLDRVLPAGSARPTLFLGMVGEYKVALRVFDAEGRPNCGEPAIVEIQATTDADVLIQLTWDIPALPNPEFRGGTDVDLHYLNPQADAWNRAPWDCFYSNKHPDWGAADDSSDDPLHWGDVTEGRGPEIITHSGLEHVTYHVGAFYYEDWHYGPSDVTVRVFTRGVEAFTMKGQRLEPKQFWDAARIDGRTLSVRPVDAVTQGFP